MPTSKLSSRGQIVIPKEVREFLELRTGDEVLDTVEAVLRTAQFDVGDKDVLWQALGDARRGPADFADCVIGRRTRAGGADRTVTFDGALAGSPLFEML